MKEPTGISMTDGQWDFLDKETEFTKGLATHIRMVVMIAECAGILMVVQDTGVVLLALAIRNISFFKRVMIKI